MAFSASFLDELSARTDIVSLVSKYVRLTPKGSNLFGLCPFHSEKTASFSVSPDKQIFHCFGCGVGGGAVNFIMMMENLEYPEAIRYLAKEAGMQVPEEDYNPVVSARRKRILEINREAARYFYGNLSSEEGKVAVSYLISRGLSKAVIKRFGIGYATGQWDGLIDELGKKGYEKRDLLDAGLAVAGKSGKVYDRFRNRLIFPIIDLRGDVIAFGGRVLDDSIPKYLNSPDTLVFNKSNNLFALNFAKRSRQGRIILAEGYMDVIALHQAGFDSAVASLGTSLTGNQARLIARYAKECVITYDSDEAGTRAAQRAIDILKKTGVEVKVLRLPGAKDPDEFIRNNGAEAFSKLLESSENHIEYRLLSIAGKHDLKTDAGRVNYLKQAAELLAEIPNAVERSVYSQRAASTAGVPADAMKIEVERAYKARIKKVREEGIKKVSNPVRMVQPAKRELRYENVVSARAEETIISIILTKPDVLDNLPDSLAPEKFSSPMLGKFFGKLVERYNEGLSLNLMAMAEELSADELSHITSFIQRPVEPRLAEKTMADCVEVIERESAKRLALESDEYLLLMADLMKEKKGAV